MYEKIKRYYDLGLYTDEQIADFVRKGKLTPEQYESITGEPYVVGGEYATSSDYEAALARLGVET